MRRRFLQGLEDRVRGFLVHGLGREHDIHPHGGFEGTQDDVLVDRPHLVEQDERALRRDGLDIGVDAVADPPAGVAVAAPAVGADESGGELHGGVGLAHSHRSGEEVRVGGFRDKGAAQDGQRKILTDDVREERHATVQTEGRPPGSGAPGSGALKRPNSSSTAAAHAVVHVLDRTRSVDHPDAVRMILGQPPIAFSDPVEEGGLL